MKRKTKRIILPAAAMALGLMGVYGIFAWQGNSRQAIASETDAISRAMAKGPMKRLVIHSKRRDVSDLVLFDGEGNPHRLSEWKGRVLLVNFWATWCFPCRKEMPKIANLQKAFPKEEFLIIAASEDRKGYKWAKEGLYVLDGDNLLLLMDQGAKALRKLGERGLPTTILVDRKGREFARLIGPAEWDSEEAKAIIRAAIAEK